MVTKVQTSFVLTKRTEQERDLLERMNLLGKKEEMSPNIAMRRLLNKVLPKLPKNHKKVIK